MKMLTALQFLYKGIKKMINKKELKKILHFNTNSGVFTWKKTASNRVKKGSVAGCISRGYIVIRINNRLYPAHRLAWLYVTGEFPKDQLDHINHIRSDNRIGNLREVDNKENSRNASKRITNTSGVMGVGWHKQSQKWMSRIVIDDKAIHLGMFTEFHEAVNARKNAEVLYGFHKNYGKEM